MQGILDWIRNEPAVVSQVVGQALALGAAFGLELSMEQTAALNGVVALVVAFIIRAKVTPMAKIEEISPSTARQLE